MVRAEQDDFRASWAISGITTCARLPVARCDSGESGDRQRQDILLKPQIHLNEVCIRTCLEHRSLMHGSGESLPGSLCQLNVHGGAERSRAGGDIGLQTAALGQEISTGQAPESPPRCLTLLPIAPAFIFAAEQVCGTRIEQRTVRYRSPATPVVAIRAANRRLLDEHSNKVVEFILSVNPQSDMITILQYGRQNLVPRDIVQLWVRINGRKAIQIKTRERGGKSLCSPGSMKAGYETEPAEPPSGTARKMGRSGQTFVENRFEQ